MVFTLLYLRRSNLVPLFEGVRLDLSWEIDGETVETVSDYFFGLQNHCTGDLSNPGIEPRSPNIAGRFFMS